MAFVALSARAQDTPAPAKMTAQQDHQQMMDQLHITSLRPGADGNHPQAPNAANYDEAKANPYPKLPDPLVLKNGKKVKSAKFGGASGVRRLWMISIGKFMGACPRSRRR